MVPQQWHESDQVGWQAALAEIPELVGQHQQRQAVIERRITNRQLHGAEAMLNSWNMGDQSTDTVLQPQLGPVTNPEPVYDVVQPQWGSQPWTTGYRTAYPGHYAPPMPSRPVQGDYHTGPIADVRTEPRVVYEDIYPSQQPVHQVHHQPDVQYAFTQQAYYDRPAPPVQPGQNFGDRNWTQDPTQRHALYHNTMPHQGPAVEHTWPDDRRHSVVEPSISPSLPQQSLQSQELQGMPSSGDVYTPYIMHDLPPPPPRVSYSGNPTFSSTLEQGPSAWAPNHSLPETLHNDVPAQYPILQYAAPGSYEPPPDSIARDSSLGNQIYETSLDNYEATAKSSQTSPHQSVSYSGSSHESPNDPTLPHRPSLDSRPGTVLPFTDFSKANRELLERPGKVATKRAKTGIPANDEVSSAPPQRTARKNSKKVTQETDFSCMLCQTLLGKLIMRGPGADMQVAHAPAYTCLVCEPGPAGSSVATEDSDLPVGATPSRPPPKSKNGLLRKRHKRRDEHALTACDVCLRDICTGSVVATETNSPVQFQVELVCDSCRTKYQRCSDCGGGGGARLGVGKWRCKELFHEKRKTCTLSHTRLGALSDMYYDTHSVSEIPPSEVDEIAEICGAIFKNTMFASLCIPEVLEQNSAPVKGFAGVGVMAERGWGAIEQMIRVDIEQSQGIRRYLGLRSCTPNPRKGVQPLDLAPSDDYNKVILHEKKDVVGFLLAEWDKKRGDCFLSVIVPWAMGEVYDATTILIQRLFARIEDDRSDLNVQRQARGQELYPPVERVWTMMFFKRESRMMHHLNKKRGFAFLDVYLNEHPEADPRDFPPHRPVYLPVVRQEGWQVLVKVKRGEHDDFFAIRRTAASEEVERKKKEQRARARRLKEEEQDSKPLEV